MLCYTHTHTSECMLGGLFCCYWTGRFASMTPRLIFSLLGKSEPPPAGDIIWTLPEDSSLSGSEYGRRERPRNQQRSARRSQWCHREEVWCSWSRWNFLCTPLPAETAASSSSVRTCQKTQKIRPVIYCKMSASSIKTFTNGHVYFLTYTKCHIGT